jgi:hypothetical protein
MLSLFDYSGGKVIPGVMAKMVPELQEIEKAFPNTYMSVYHYIFGMTCTDASISPYASLPEDRREEVVLSDSKMTEYLEDLKIEAAMKKCRELYETPVLRSFKGAAKMLDKVAIFLDETEITTGKDGSASEIRAMMKELPDYWAAYKKWESILKEEQAVARGRAKIRYDFKPGYVNIKKDDDE